MSTLSYHESTYRTEIDGLRAIAVLSVILFHAGFKLFSGGFVGVDVFFVISGYLITSIILREKQAGTFSILHFYERRARRILPGLFFIMLFCLPLAWFVLLPDQLVDFSKSLEAVPLFISNLFFWKNTGYFSANTEEVPLIHTWSLGIEEQFYLFFPLFLIFFWRIGHKKLMILIATLILISLFISEYFVQQRPSAAFFFIFPRAWELLIGSILAYSAFKKIELHEYLSLGCNRLISMSGFLMIILSICMFSKNTPFPGLYALIPVVGTALIIGFSLPKTFVYQFLSNQYMVKIGLISYSAYLWHQPLFSFVRIYSLESAPQYVFILFIGLTLLLAFFTWKYIEQPFRNRKNFSRPQIFLLSITGTLFFIIIGVIGHYKKGFPERLSSYQQPLFTYSNESNIFNEKLGCFLDPDQNETHFGSCTFESTGHKNILLWGDSQAAHLVSGLQTLHQYHHLTQLTASACLPIVDMNFPKRPHCRSINTYVLERIKTNPPDQVILAGRWEPRDNNVGSRHQWHQLKKTIDQLHAIGIKDIVVIGPAPIWDAYLPNIMARFNVPFDKLPRRLKSHVIEDSFLIDHEMQIFAQQWQVKYVSLLSMLCNHQGCLSRLGNKSDQLLYFDDSHFTQAGSQYVAAQLGQRYCKRGLFRRKELHFTD